MTLLFVCAENLNLYPSSKLLCVVCKDSFSNPWDLMQHAQAAHMVNIYEIGESDEEDDSSTTSKSNKLDKTNGESHNNNTNGSSCNGTAMHSNENVSRYFLPLFPFLKHLCKKNPSNFCTNFFMVEKITKIHSSRKKQNRKISFRNKCLSCARKPGKKLNDKSGEKKFIMRARKQQKCLLIIFLIYLFLMAILML
jgi:hypothetical protein